MSIEYTIDFIEEKKNLLFVAGIALSDIALDDTFTALHHYGNQKKSKKLLGTIELRVASIILDGEPVATLSTNTAALIALSGEFTLIIEQAQALQWRKKSGRLIRTSDAALTLADA